ncbi:MAG: hypothetical protein R8P61_34195 [Bacteroidia bacterium]|nr:hypothetical protein [Bacteroidia bacterium]
MRTHSFYLAIILPFLFLSKLQSQVFAETEGGARILVFDDGSWAFPGEAKPVCGDGSSYIPQIYSWKKGDMIHSHIFMEEKEIIRKDSIIVLETVIDTSVNTVRTTYSRKTHRKITSYEYKYEYVTKILIGTEIFELWVPEKYRDGMRITSEEGKIVSKTNRAMMEYRGNYTIEDAKTICANEFMEIFRSKIKRN